ncbi:putative quinol monooxygenase [Nocardia sp. NPDC052112]|uniref:putative quinol monooxygenase n=1 Tax=Nocardia sp. NPDC052112 TaxID=3155646 RepID=UPI003442DA13
MSLTVIARLIARPGARGMLTAIALANAQASLTRENGGCLRFEVLADIDDDRVVQLVTTFRDQDAFERHRRTDHFAAWLTESAPLLDPAHPKTHHYATSV